MCNKTDYEVGLGLDILQKDIYTEMSGDNLGAPLEALPRSIAEVDCGCLKYPGPHHLTMLKASHPYRA